MGEGKTKAANVVNGQTIHGYLNQQRYITEKQVYLIVNANKRNKVRITNLNTFEPTAIL